MQRRFLRSLKDLKRFLLAQKVILWEIVLLSLGAVLNYFCWTFRLGEAVSFSVKVLILVVGVLMLLSLGLSFEIFWKKCRAGRSFGSFGGFFFM